MGTDCPSCNEEFESEHGMKIHHQAKHGESLAKRECTCASCGEIFEEFQSRIDNGRGVFCSVECKHSEGQTTVECSTCGTSVDRPAHRADRYSRHFCSKSCYLQLRSKEFESWESSEFWTFEGGPEQLSCSNCGDDIELYGHRIRENNFCSLECRSAYFTGTANPNYKHGEAISYEGGWKRHRKEALEKALFECEECGCSREQHYDEYGIDLHVHHQIPYIKFDDPTDAHKQSNLRVLCVDCHAAVENSDRSKSGNLEEGCA